MHPWHVIRQEVSRAWDLRTDVHSEHDVVMANPLALRPSPGARMQQGALALSSLIVCSSGSLPMQAKCKRNFL